jgi:iron(III) transport system ATP-binding protein
MSVFDNVAFPLVYGYRKMPMREVKERVMRTLSLVELEGLENRPAPLLSGGQQQRVALARALVYEAKLLLLDEPLSNLDAKLREEMRVELVRLVKELQLTAVYVTHDQLEALIMSDRIALMHEGRIVEEGSPRDIYLSPQNIFTASFIGNINLLEGKVLGSVVEEPWGSCLLVETVVGRLLCAGGRESKEGDECLVAWRPEAVELYPERPRFSHNVLEGVLKFAGFRGDSVEVIVRSESQPFRVNVSSFILSNVGDRVFLYLAPERSIVIPKGSLSK